MAKRILSIALAILMLMSVAVVAVSAAETSNESTGASQKIRFDASGWSNFKEIYCYVWINGGDNFFAWGGSDSLCKKVVGNIYEYDLANLSKSTKVEGGYKSGVDYCVIFHANTGVQTYDLTLGDECFGDTAKMTGKKIENPMDSEKEAFEAKWNKSTKYGAHRAITSTGKFVGEVLCPGEDGGEIIGDWLVNQPSAGNYCDRAEVVAQAMKEFKVKDIDAIYGYINTKDLGIQNAEDLLKILEDGYKIAYGEEKKVDKTKADDIKKKIDNGAELDDVSTDAPTTTTGGTTTTTTNNSGTGADGQNDTILFVLAGVMLLAAGAFVVSRKRREV